YNSEVQKHPNIVFFVDNEKDVKIAVWGREQSIPLSKKKLLIINGESISDSISEKSIIESYRVLKEENYQGIEINSDNEYSIDFEIGIRRAGFVRPLGFFACPLTINFQLQKDFNFNRNWKRNVKKAIAANLKFEEVKVITSGVIQDIISMFKEMADLKDLGYQLENESLTALLNSHNMRLFMVYDETKKPVAARIVHDNKPFASDVYAANALMARENGATYYMMQHIFEKLKEEKFTEFDFGRIPPSDHATDSVYIFKNASRGDKIQYNGEWCFYKNKQIEFLMFLYKSFKLKKQRY
ncbi:MAG: hypothetical protein ABI295_02020, partial [Xanthomarina sp.]